MGRVLRLFGIVVTILSVLAVGRVSGDSAWAAEPLKPGVYAAPPQRVGEGTAHAFVTIGPGGTPVAIGVVLTEAALALKRLPTGAEWVLQLPKEAAGSGYDHVGLDWHLHGHEPPGIYTVPHFDFHFYMISYPERQKITVGNLAIGTKQPGPDSLAPGYVLPPETFVPGMGTHAVQPAATEFRGQPFTHTFIYGYHEGRLIFSEPMVARAFLAEKRDATEAVSVPKAYPRPGYYPTKYSVRYDGKRREYTVALEALVARTP